MVTFDSTDLDNAVSESGVVHESVTNTDHDNASVLKQGYSIENPYLSSNLVGYWPLQEDSGSTAYDFSGNGNDGSITGATVNQTGLLGTSSYSFDGTDDQIDTTYNADFGTGSFTISAWIYPTALNSNYNKDIVSTWDGSGFIFRRLGENYQFQYNGNNIDSGVSLTLDTWSLYSVTVNSETNDIILYVDGDNIYSDSDSQDVTNGTPVSIGGRPSNSNNFPGKILDVRIYNRALTASEVQTLYDVANTSGTLTTGYKSV